MKKVKKILLFGGIGLLVLIVVAVIVVGLFLGNIVKAGVNSVGPKITQTTLTVDAVDLSLLTGSVTVKNLAVGNPEGYSKTSNAISIARTAVSANPMTLLSDKIVVKSIRLESPEITFVGGLNGNNLSKLLDNVSGSAKNTAPPAASPAATASSPAGKKLEVDDLLITGAKVHGTLVFGGREMPLPSLPLPDIHLTDLGKGPEGITAADLTKQVLSVVVSDTLKAVANAATNLGKEAGKTVDAGVNKITTGVGGLLKKATH